MGGMFWLFICALPRWIVVLELHSLKGLFSCFLIHRPLTLDSQALSWSRRLWSAAAEMKTHIWGTIILYVRVKLPSPPSASSDMWMLRYFFNYRFYCAESLQLTWNIGEKYLFPHHHQPLIPVFISSVSELLSLLSLRQNFCQQVVTLLSVLTWSLRPVCGYKHATKSAALCRPVCHCASSSGVLAFETKQTCFSRGIINQLCCRLLSINRCFFWHSIEMREPTDVIFKVMQSCGCSTEPIFPVWSPPFSFVAFQPMHTCCKCKLLTEHFKQLQWNRKTSESPQVSKPVGSLIKADSDRRCALMTWKLNGLLKLVNMFVSFFFKLKSHPSLFFRDPSAKTEYAKAESRENGQILWPHCSSSWGDQRGGLSSLLWWVSGIDLPLFPRSTVPVIESESFIVVWYSLHILVFLGVWLLWTSAVLNSKWIYF